MIADRERVKALFFEAIDLPEAEIGPFLDKACGADAALRAEVASLLGYHDDADVIAAHDTGEGHLFQTMHAVLGGVAPEVRPAPLHDRYSNLGLLGRGGFGSVVRAYDHDLRRTVAHKRAHDPSDAHGRILMQEARLLAYLDLPGVVQVHDTGVDEGGRFYTMRVLQGHTLRERLDGSGLSLGDVVRVLTRVAETMAGAHDKGVLHLDLKPDNVFLHPYGHVSVIDWGIARFYDLDRYAAALAEVGETAAPDVAAYDGLAGTPDYMAPEQRIGAELGPGADLYAFGRMLFEGVAGRLPEPGERLSDVRGDVPARLDALAVRLLAEAPVDRPESFASVAAELVTLQRDAGHGAERRLEVGDVLFRRGEAGAEAYLVLSGRVQITVSTPEGERVVAERSTGDLIGEQAVVSQTVRSATVTALEPTVVAVVDGARIDDALEAASPLLAKMVRSLSDRLREATAKVADD